VQEAPLSRRPPLFYVSESPIHGRGVYAARQIRKGTRILEYTGERISQEEGARRYDDDAGEYVHVLLFTVDDDTVIDAAVGGNEARFVNHSCEPNCEAVWDEGRIFIEAIRTIRLDEELTYDYQLERPGIEVENMAERYPCFCGKPSCRGTMLSPEQP
jgi:SET domain-containing protein